MFVSDLLRLAGANRLPARLDHDGDVHREKGERIAHQVIAGVGHTGPNDAQVGVGVCVAIQDVQRLAGHASIETTASYQPERGGVGAGGCDAAAVSSRPPVRLITTTGRSTPRPVLLRRGILRLPSEIIHSSTETVA
jgi:hypothetical protein